MTPEPEPSPGAAARPVLTVAAVARRLGVAPSTLRTWDRRYGLGPSAHTAGSHRRYGPDDLHRLTVMRALTLEGVPPAEAAQIALSHPIGAAGAAVPVDVAVPAAGSVHRVAAPESREPDRRRAVDPAGARPADPDDDATRARDDDVLHLDDGPDLGGHRDAAGLAWLAELGGLGGPPAGTGSPAALSPLAAGSPATGPTAPRAPARPYPAVVPTGTSEPGRGSALWFTDPLPAVPRPVSPAEGLGAGDLCLGPAPTAVVGRAGGGRVLSLPAGSPRARGLARAAMALDTAQLARLLREAIAAYGVVGVWDSLIAPVLQGLGERWRATGEGVDVEHAFSEAVMAAMRGVTATLYRPRNVIPVLLACAEGDLHSLPLHVVAAALAEEEVCSRMLGTGLQARDLVA
ncbi:MAG TPA: MerR family transcriptional regulator, partial [Kineosporiaceae bacterium]